MSSSPLPNKRPVGRPKKFSCEQFDCMVEQNRDFNALLTIMKSTIRRLKIFTLIIME